jgi:hypothetical protein
MKDNNEAEKEFAVNTTAISILVIMFVIIVITLIS